MLFQHSFQYIYYSFQHALKFSTRFSTHLEIFNIVLNMHYSFQHILKFSTCCFKIVFNTYYSFQHALKFSTCFSTCLEIFNIVLNLHTCTEIFNILFQHELQFSEHADIFNMIFYSFQKMLKISTCFFTVFRTC